MKILVTGATGFIGSAFTTLALSRGHEIAGLALPSENLPPDLAAAEHLEWLRGTLDEAPWKQIAAFVPDVCLHGAWITTPGIYLESPDNERFRDASLRFLRSVIELGTRHIVGLGTCIEYQIAREPLSETRTPIVPTTTYARCKNELRVALETEAKARDLDFCWGRVFYPYGPGEHPSRLCSAIIQKLTRGEKTVLKTPDSTKDYIYIQDLAAAILTVVEQRAVGPINLGTGVGINVRQIARTLGAILGHPELIEEMDPPQTDPLGFVVADASRVRELGWRPQYELRQGLENLVATIQSASRQP